MGQFVVSSARVSHLQAHISNKKLKWLVSARFACFSSSLLALLDSALERTSVELSHSTQETITMLLMPTMDIVKNIMLITVVMMLLLTLDPLLLLEKDVSTRSSWLKKPNTMM